MTHTFTHLRRFALSAALVFGATTSMAQEVETGEGAEVQTAPSLSKPAPASPETVAAPENPSTNETAQSDRAPKNGVEPDAPVAGVVTQPVPPVVPKPPKSLRIATWDGAYGDAQRRALLDPFSKDTGIRMDAFAHTGGGELLKQQAAEALDWDLADVPYHVAKAACDAGTVARIDPVALSTSETDLNRDDFLPEAFGDCALGGSVWSSVIAFDASKYRSRLPSRLEDFFDTQTFPGKRALPRSPRYVLEMALMADGVSADAVYAALETPGGQKRAFAKLETIRNSIVWRASARERVELLQSGKVAMAIGYNGRLFLETAGRESTIALLWDGQIYDLDVWVIPKSTTHMPTALKFVAYAAQADVMARQASLLPYGPVRTSASQMVGKHATLDVDLSQYLPTNPDNFSRALRFDEAWWSKNSAQLNDRFHQWETGAAAPSTATEDADVED